MKLTTKILKQLIKEEIRKVTESREDHIQGIKKKIASLEKKKKPLDDEKKEIENKIEQIRSNPQLGDAEARSFEEKSGLHKINMSISPLEDEIELLNGQLEALQSGDKLRDPTTIGDERVLPRGPGRRGYE